MLDRIAQEQSAFTLAEVMIAMLALVMILGLVLPAFGGLLR